MIVVDYNKALVSNNNISEDDISDVVTDNQLLGSVVLRIKRYVEKIKPRNMYGYICIVSIHILLYK